MALANQGITADDFDNNALADFGVTVSRTPRTKVQLTDGTESLVDGTPVNITAIIHVKPTQYNNDKSGDVISIDGYIEVSGTTTVNKNDLITYNGKDYIVDFVQPRRPAGDVVLYKYCGLLSYKK